MDSKKVYFIALLPNERLQEEVTKLKEYAAIYFSTRRALTSPPHITLQPPFVWEGNNLDPIRATIKDVCQIHFPFEITLKNFHHFSTRVIFIDVEISEPLIQLHQNLRKQMREEHQLEDRFDSFHPHMTVAFKDLKKEIFPDAWAYFSKLNYQKSFIVDQLTLLERDGKKWNIFEQFKFQGSK
jgi:2'-5' RNA ligase